MKYILMMNATKAEFDWYARWPKNDLQANFAFMHAFNKELKDSGVLVATDIEPEDRLTRMGDL